MTNFMEKIKELEKDYDFTVSDYVDDKEIDSCGTIDEVIELIEKANEDNEITNTEIIYFSKAMEYLTENDTSLRESMEIAYEYGYETKNLNSELLASLLATRNNEEDFGKFLNELRNAEIE